MKKLCLVIPCYNEESGLALQEYRDFIKQNPMVSLCFVNDGSKDGTMRVLEELKTTFPNRISLLSYAKNEGKAEAIRRGIHLSNEKYDHSLIGYLDADLSTSLKECTALTTYLKNSVVFAFGSRIMKIGSTITRNPYRFIIGRIIATIISSILGIKVYDTQCGCKLFTKQLSEMVFETPFISRWLFDVEIFQRIIALYGRESALGKMIEVPLEQWIDKGQSKVKPIYFFRLWYDLYKIDQLYKRIKRTAFYPPIIIQKDVQEKAI